ncbi:undecaprenyl-diphosphate phosphatase [Phenylobacterium sp.]|jgi:undecaprenyl-diphosphatase|uniref:undecaprenyl-diphosphate phosphatase n=1 Tax=Phenylobacterium sp. TaxID=1871053 RepID=UPI002E37053F|nr:undecaprenyl-diphosphate phosphatase [Phenylobacterium sp.]HEX4711363.1 undecaprenyl-diphosphate phosphatase [Phenylobacterium sp.]
MSDWIYAVILGVVEGLTEFIPVSSTGMLLLTKQALGLTDVNWDTFIVLIQLGAILAVVVLYFSRLWKVVLRLPSDPRARRFALSVIVAFLPAAVLGVLLHDLIKQVLFESPRVICISLILGGVVLLLIDRYAPHPTRDDAMALPLPTSLVIGFFQCLAMIPGVSRSGATIVGSMLMGVEKRAAAEFSFFLAIPTMAGAFTVDAWKNRHELAHGHMGLVAIGFVVSFIVALGVIRAMLAIVTRRGYAPFGWLRIAIGGVGLALLMRG